MMSQTWLRLRGSSPVVGSSRKSSSGVTTIDAAMSSLPPHAPGVGLGLLLRRIGEPEGRREARGAPPRVHARKPRRRAMRMRFSRPVRSSSTEANCPVRLTLPRTASASRTTSWPKTRAAPESGRKQGREHPDHRRLARAVRAEDAEDLALRNFKVHPIYRDVVAEAIDKPLRAYRRGAPSCAHFSLS